VNNGPDAQPSLVTTGTLREPYRSPSTAGTTAIIGTSAIGVNQRPANILITPNSQNPPAQPDFATTGNIYVQATKGALLGLLFGATGADNVVGSFDVWGYRPIVNVNSSSTEAGILYVPFFIISGDFVAGTTTGTANAIWTNSTRFADTIAAVTDVSMTEGGAINPTSSDNGVAQIWFNKDNSPFFLVRVRRDDVGGTAGTAATTANVAWTQI
jgi:hypothetical protein